MSNYRVMDKYGYTIEYFDTLEDAISFCDKTKVAVSVEDCADFDTIYSK